MTEISVVCHRNCGTEFHNYNDSFMLTQFCSAVTIISSHAASTPDKHLCKKKGLLMQKHDQTYYDGLFPPETYTLLTCLTARLTHQNCSS